MHGDRMWNRHSETCHKVALAFCFVKSICQSDSIRLQSASPHVGLSKAQGVNGRDCEEQAWRNIRSKTWPRLCFLSTWSKSLDMSTFWQPNFQVWLPGGRQNGTFGSSRGVQGRLLGHLWAAMGAKDLHRGTSRWFMWAHGRLSGYPGEPREAHPAAKGRQRGAK